MKFAIITIAGFVFGMTSTQAAPSYQQTFDAWKVGIQIDDFEGEVQPTLTSDVLSIDGQKIGTMYIHFFVRTVSTKDRFGSALVSFSIRGLDPTFPACDYEHLKYKIDSDESKFFPTRGYACPAMEFKSDMANRFLSGETFRFSTISKVGVVSLKGFKEAWEYTLPKLKK